MRNTSDVYIQVHGPSPFDAAGSRPGGRSTFLSGKVDKTMLAVAWPFGCPARFADPGGAQTRGAWPEMCRRAQTVRAFSPVSAARLGPATRPGSLATLAHLVARLDRGQACVDVILQLKHSLTTSPHSSLELPNLLTQRERILPRFCGR